MGDFICLVKAEMLIAAYQAIYSNELLEKSKKIWETSYNTKQEISKIWLRTFFNLGK